MKISIGQDSDGNINIYAGKKELRLTKDEAHWLKYQLDLIFPTYNYVSVSGSTVKFGDMSITGSGKFND